MLRYKIFNPNRFTVPLMLKDKENGSFTQVNVLPRKTIEITGDQVSDSVRNLSSAPRNVLRMTRIEDEKKAEKKNPSASAQTKPVTTTTEQKPAEQKPAAEKNAGAAKKNGGGK